MSVDPGAAAIRNAMLELAEALKPVQELIDGQRADLCRRGYSADTAERMAADLHAHVLWLMRGGAS
jgi:hypothetical protein